MRIAARLMYACITSRPAYSPCAPLLAGSSFWREPVISLSALSAGDHFLETGT